MGKVTWIESPPPDHPIYSGGPDVFSRPESKPAAEAAAARQIASQRVV